MAAALLSLIIQLIAGELKQSREGKALSQEIEEQASKPKLDFQQYAAAMEHILVIANRLAYKKKLPETCKDCPAPCEDHETLLSDKTDE
jgi:hypothetical protein